MFFITSTTGSSHVPTSRKILVLYFTVCKSILYNIVLNNVHISIKIIYCCYIFTVCIVIVAAAAAAAAAAAVL